MRRETNSPLLAMHIKSINPYSIMKRVKPHQLVSNTQNMMSFPLFFDLINNKLEVVRPDGNEFTATSPGLFAEADEDINIKKGLDLSPGFGARRPFFNRTFGRLDKGSLRGSIFALCATAIGSGVLSLPYILALNGWVLGILLIMLGKYKLRKFEVTIVFI